MNRKGAILLPILTILFLVSLAAAGGLFYLYQKEHAQNIILQGQISDLEKRQTLTEGKLNDTKKMAAELQLRLQESKSKVSNLTDEFDKEKIAHAEALSQLEQFKSDLEQQKAVRQDLENQLKSAQEDAKKIKKELSSIKQQKTELEEKLKNMEAEANSVELGTVVINNDEPVVTVDNPPKAEKQAKPAKKSAKTKSLEGRIMVVNKEFNFVVVNLGSKDGVKVGDEFTVVSGGKSIGSIKIEKVHESMSAAGFPIEIKDYVKENDQITSKAK
ncbi:MAG: hypothetical protein PHY35_01455 [Candidatus Omnitrophica bacterium]|nr:hypothetical protein [Candidatus Omnitrophota bacterium]